MPGKVLKIWPPPAVFLIFKQNHRRGGGKLPPLNGARVKTGVKHDFYQT